MGKKNTRQVLSLRPFWIF